MNEEEQSEFIKLLLTRFKADYLVMGFFAFFILSYTVDGPYFFLYTFTAVATWGYFRNIANTRYEWLWFAIAMSGAPILLTLDEGIELTGINALLCSLTILLTTVYTYFVHCCGKAQGKI